jgi:hypothetical protein
MILILVTSVMLGLLFLPCMHCFPYWEYFTNPAAKRINKPERMSLRPNRYDLFILKTDE